MFYFLPMAMHLSVIVSHPPLHQQAYTVLTTSIPLRSPVCESQSCCSHPWFLFSRVRSNQCFPTLSQPFFFGSTRGSSVIHRHSFTPLSPLLDLGRFHRNSFKAFLHSTHLLARHGYCVHMRSLSVCIASVQCFGRRRMKR